MGVLVNLVKKFSEFGANELQNYNYYKFSLKRIQKDIIKKNPYVKNKDFERAVKNTMLHLGIG